jgi:hypothetical protein
MINFFDGYNELSHIKVLADNVCEDTFKMIKKYVPEQHIINCNKGSGAQTFNVVLDMALTQKDDEIAYFVENDYIHRKRSQEVMMEGFGLGADFVCLYAHPDKFIPAKSGGNPLVEDDGGYVTKLFKGKSAYWHLVESTTMTFASKVKTLKKCGPILRKWTTGTYPEDFKMFLELRDLGFSLISPIPTFSTHGESAWLSSLIGTEYSHLKEIDGWNRIIYES